MSSTNAKNDCQLTLDLVTNLKSESKSEICALLTTLKKDAKCHKQFVKDGGLAPLVRLLRSENIRILDLTLSVLANMSLHGYVRQECRSLNPAPKVTSILKNNKSQSIQCRACRLVGNLAECSWHAKALCQSGVIRIITNSLKSWKTTRSVQVTAIRAIRNIWSGLESSREEILEAGTLREITTIFVVANERKEDKNREELIHVCLKATCVFLQTSDPRCGAQLRGKTDMDGFKSIVEQCQAKNKMAIKCLYILSQNAECRPILGTLGAIESIVSSITEDSELSWELLASLCLFCREAVNRARIRSGTGLEAMLGVLKTTEHQRYHPMLLHALAQFIYDDPSILKMIKNGLLDVLIMKLKEMTLEGADDCMERYNPKKRGACSPPNRRAEIKFNRSDFGRFSLDYKQDDWSPGSARSMCSSPPSTPPLSSFFEDDTDDSDSSAEENYSPVCSDTECAENDEELENEIESPKSYSPIVTDSMAESHDFGNTAKITSSKQSHVWTLSLLSRLSHSNEPIDKMADPTTIQPLVSYIRTTKNSRASRILARIIRNRAYLVTLLKQGFVFELQAMRGSETHIRQLSASAETGCALGELASILLRGQEAHKYVIAVSIPFLIQSRDALRTLLKTHGGLTLVFRVLTDKRHELHVNAVYAVCRLANALDIRPEMVDRNLLEGAAAGIDYSKNLEHHLKPSIVTFELDDGTTVDAHRNILCQKSEFFSAMLEGNFCESGKRRVKLKNTSKEGLDTLLLAVNGCSYSNRPIESLLDAVLLADRFLIPDILESLIERSLSSINFGNISRTWHWARKNSCHELRIGCIKIFLTAKSTKPERLETFDDFSRSEHFSQFIDDVEQVLKTGLSCR